MTSSGPIVGLTHAATEQKQLTAEGTILGTFQYMAPEQLEGAEADARTDIWAFGAVLYEMVTGRKAFEGKSKTSLIAAIVDRNPAPITSIQPMVPVALDRVIRTCLEKDPDERWQNAHDIARELHWLTLESSESRGATSTTGAFRRRERLGWWLAAAMLLVAVVALAVGLSRRAPTTTSGAMRLSLLAPPGTWGGLSISPDGTRVTFSAPGPAGRRLLWIRPLSSDVAHPLFGTEEATEPFWSPDSRHIAFFADGKLKRIDASGGTAVTICDAPRPAGGSWNGHGDIIFTPLALGPIHRVLAAGGIAKPLLNLSRGEGGQWFPRFLPDDRHFIYLSWSQHEATGIYLSSLDELDGKLLLPATRSAIYADGFILFRQGESLMAQSFDLRRRILAGDRVTIAERIGDEFSASAAGILVFEEPGTTMRQLVWMDRTGKEITRVGEPGPILPQIHISPDGSKAAVVLGELPPDIWLVDLTRGTRSRFTFDLKSEHAPAWSPDGRQIAFSSNRNGPFDVYVKSVAAEGGERLLFSSPQNKWIKSWSPDGRFLAYVEVDPSGKTRAGNAKTDLWILPLSNPTKPMPYFTSDTFEDTNLFSPDGRWMAYISDETGRWDVFVSSFPKTAAKWQISTHGVPAFPQAFKWRRDGKEILYLSPGWTVMSVEVKSGTTFEAGEPKPLFNLEPEPGWDVTADGRRFLVAKRLAGTETVPLTVITNWTAELRQ